ncbi:nucleotidyltransferase domain-containing protein (plasmid) [Rhodococcus pseudokoreensis]|uniref:Nucleotidyltransferase domain-containing protein n=1 Tax=Rhodococcus pseudokoreensis TaxID=2811421 RepID=A0A974ZRJ1_9NOCA|nr:nucleotidyltransferase domain-containing protein [Rhodococcus pseudokoreensis]QSE87462.1 nucleotidyltransferase domain-containing protein [Rhodococcus pseudokoreensis]
MTESLDGRMLAEALRRLALRQTEIDGVMDRIVDDTIGLLLYGSRARGDFVPSSDFDLLRFTTAWDSPTFKSGRVSVSSYTPEQLLSANGTLFGTHIQRDGRVLIERNDELTSLVAAFSPAEPDKLLERVRRYSMILNQPEAEMRSHCLGLVRLARYLLRTAIYAIAMAQGKPCFSVRELAAQYGEPRLATLLASDPEITGPGSDALLEELVSRLVVAIGPLPSHDHGSLHALAVRYWDVDRSLAALAIRAADEDDADSLDYSDLPKVLL